MSQEYRYDFTHGPGFWRSWTTPALVAEEDGDYASFTRFHAPGTLDPNHIDGIGSIWLLSHLSLPDVGGPGTLNLNGADIKITLRAHDLQANGNGLYFWIVRYVPETGVTENYYYGLQSTNWAYTGTNLIDALGESWTTITVHLSPDLAGWTYAGNHPGLQGDWANRYVRGDLPEALGAVDATLHLVFAGSRADRAPSGFVDIADIAITTVDPAIPNPELRPPQLYLNGVEDTPLSGTLPNPLAAPASDGDGDGGAPVPQFALVADSVTGGSVTLDPLTGAYVFTPAADYWGPDRNGITAGFRYTVTNGETQSAPQWVYITLAPINDAPQTSGRLEDATTNFETPLAFTLFAGTDVDGDALRFRLVDDSVTHGTLQLDAQSGRYVFTPEAGFSGTASFRYVVNDGTLDSAEKLVAIEVRAADDPFTLPTLAQVNADFARDQDLDQFIYWAVRLAIAGDPSASLAYGRWLASALYVARDYALAIEAFETALAREPSAHIDLGYLYLEGKGADRDYAAARSHFEAVADQPEAQYRLGLLDAYGLGGPVDATAALGHLLTAAKAGHAEAMYVLGRRYLTGTGAEAQADDAYFWLGTALRFDAQPGLAQFRDLLRFNQRAAADSLSPERIAELDAAILHWAPGDASPGNDAPQAASAPEAAAGLLGAEISGQLLPGSDADGDRLRYVLASGSPVAADITLDPVTGIWRYTPGTLVAGTVRFGYLLTDGFAQSAIKYVDLRITPVTLAQDDGFAIEEGGSIGLDEAVSVLGNDFVADDSGSLTLVALADSGDAVGTALAGRYGTLTVGADGALRYEADRSGILTEGETGIDRFTYQVSDANGVLATAEIIIRIAGRSGKAFSGSGTLLGSAGVDQLTGGADADVLLGLAGDDVLAGGPGAANTLQGGAGNDRYVVTAAGDSVIELPGEGIDTVETDRPSYTLPADVENLVYIGSGNFTGIGNGLANSITGGARADVLSGGAGDDALLGADGDDLLIGGAGDNQLDGGAGIDTAYYGNDPAGVVVDLAAGAASNGYGGTDVLVAIEGVIGSDFADRLGGDAGANQLNGLGGDDLLEGLAGNDVLVGSAGFDTADYRRSPARVVASLASASAQDGFGGTDILIGIEALMGSAFNDDLTGDSADNHLDGGDGSDLLEGLAGDDALIGGAGFDVASYRRSAAGVIVNLATGQAQDGFGGTDSLAGIEALIGSAFADRLIGDDGENVIEGGAGDDRLEGGGGYDELFGGTGNDVLDGGSGDDWLEGGAGDDRYIVDADGGLVIEAAGGGDDSVETGLAAYTLPDQVERLVFAGTGSFTGTGNALDNVIIGGTADDVLDGGAGDDRLEGGAGDDLYRVDAAGDVVIERDGEGTDTIETTLARYTLPDQVERLVFTGTGSFTGTGNALNNVLIGAAGDDVLDGGAGDDRLEGGAGDDLYRVDTAGDVVIERDGEGFDTIETDLASYALPDEVERLVFTGTGAFTGTGNALNNALIGGAGDDVLNGGAGNDVLEGGAGDDLYRVDSAGDFVIERDGEGTDTIETTLASYALPDQVERLVFTGTGSFTGTGNAQNNALIGGAADDVLDGGAGEDRLEGGAGDDLYRVDAAGDVVIEREGEGTDTIETTLARYALPDWVERLVFRGIGAFAGTGNALNNVLTGGTGDDLLDGGAGDDRLEGGAGDDLYRVDTAGDVVIERDGEGFDTIETDLASYALPDEVERLVFTGTGSFTGTGNAQSNVIIGGAGNDVLDGGAGDDRLEGGAGDDLYRVDAAGDVVIERAGGGNDTIETTLARYILADQVERLVFTGTGAFTGTGNALNNVIIGGAGDDVLDGGDGDDLLIGGAGNNRLIGGRGVDVASYAGAAAGVVVNLADGTARNGLGGADRLSGIEAVIGSAFNDVLVGDAGDNELRGGAGYDVLAGGAGNDRLYGGSGTANQLIGGTGDDVFIVEAVGDSIVEYAGEGVDTVETALARFVLPNHVERLVFTGTGRFIGVGNSGDNELIGGTGRDTLSGGAGNDILRDGGGGAGAEDELIGGTGDDIYYIEVAGSSTIEAAGGGIDEVRTALSLYGLQANIENLTFIDDGPHLAGVGNELDNVLRGGRGADSLYGRAGNDVLMGGAGAANTLLGGAGDDRYIVAALGDSIIEFADEGIDTVETALGSFVLPRYVENLVYTGTGDFIGIGSADDNRLTGGTGNDTLSGMDGNDVLIGGDGDDMLIGGAGADQFVFRGGETGVDRIIDFERGVDRVMLATSYFDPLGNVQFVQGTAALAAGPALLYDQGSGLLRFDADGSGPGAAVAIARFNPGQALALSDFGWF